MRLRHCGVAVLSMALLASLAAANPVRRLELVDAAGTTIGTVFDDVVLIETEHGQVPLRASKSSLLETSGQESLLYFSEPDCAGEVYVARGGLFKPSWIDVDSGLLRTTAAPVLVDVKSGVIDARPDAFDPAGCINGSLGELTLERVVATSFAPSVAHPAPYELRYVEETAFHPLLPCRLLDTRDGSTPLTNPGPHPLTVQGNCGVPVGARGVAINLTIVGASREGDLRLFPAGPIPAEQTSAINFVAGQTLANAQLLMLAEQGTPGAPDAQLVIGMTAAGTVHVLIDVTGYLR